MIKILSITLLLCCTEVTALQFAFKDPEYSFQALRAIAASSVGAADIGECLVATDQITEGDDESWYTQWNALAQRMEADALTYRQQGHLASARASYRRASNYYRSAEFFLHTNPKDPRILKTWRKSKECFLAAVKNLDMPVQQVHIPFEHTTLPGYLCAPDRSNKKRPLLILQTGFDGTAEELYFVVGQAAVERGYICLIFEGPGQGAVIREQDIPFRYNWETVVTPVVDYALTLDNVDKDKIALMGLSFGGYLVPRALAFEKRVKIGVANGGVYDFHEVCMQHSPPDLEKELDNAAAAKEINASIEKAMKTSPDLRWAIGNGMFTFKANTPTEWLKLTRPYNLKDVVRDITCTMLVVDSENDVQMKGQSKQLFDALRTQKDFMLFTNQEGAGEHCQIGAYCISNERIFNWLDTHLK